MTVYFALVIVLSWGYVLSGGLPAIEATLEERRAWYLKNAWVILWAPMLLALVCALAFRGKAGLMTILRRVVRFNVHPKYYLVAFALGPVVVVVMGLIFTAFGVQAFPDRPILEIAQAFGMAFAFLVVIIIGEELGWRGLCPARSAGFTFDPARGCNRGHRLGCVALGPFGTATARMRQDRRRPRWPCWR